MRGKLTGFYDIQPGDGLIPACAGKTQPRMGRNRGRGAHPRVCGENSSRPSGMSARAGSSPRVRGKLDFGAKVNRRRVAHPRVCGENPHDHRPRPERRGSSPRVRGKPLAPKSRPRGRRLIPACAGKTCEHARKHSLVGAHPRVCGENLECLLATIECLGSSPRVRGKLFLKSATLNAYRLIPACAGKTLPVVAMIRSSWAHPRVCGENTTDFRETEFGGGSSPRVRGKRLKRIFKDAGIGLIPACAGKTNSPPAPTRPAGAHPRVCGENRR